MEPLQNLHYAIGELAYAMAGIDGKIQPEEKKKFHAIVEAELRCHDFGFNISDIIFQLMEKDKTDPETAYEWAIKELKLNSHYLSPELKKTFVQVIEKIAKAYPPVNKAESNLLERFKKEIEPLHGDPVYFGK